MSLGGREHLLPVQMWPRGRTLRKLPTALPLHATAAATVSVEFRGVLWTASLFPNALHLGCSALQNIGVSLKPKQVVIALEFFNIKIKSKLGLVALTRTEARSPDPGVKDQPGQHNKIFSQNKRQNK